MTPRKRPTTDAPKRTKAKLRVERQTLRSLSVAQEDNVKGGVRGCTQRSNDPTYRSPV
jgi:hypothetical protein